MTDTKKLDAYALELQKNEAKWDHVFDLVTEGFRKKYGFFAYVSFRDLGIQQDYDDYLKEKKRIQGLMELEINKTLASLATIISNYSIPVEALLDYSKPFVLEPKIPQYEVAKPRTIDEIMVQLMDFPDDVSLNCRENALLLKPDFLTIKDVQLVKGEAVYKKNLRNAKLHLRRCELFDAKKRITILGKMVHYLIAENILPSYDNNPHSCFEQSVFSHVRDFMTASGDEIESLLELLDKGTPIAENKKLLEYYFIHIKEKYNF